MSARETSPPIMQHMVIRLGAHFERNELMCRRAWLGFTSRDEIGARAADGVFNHVCYEEREEHADEPAKERDVGFVGSGAKGEGPGYQDGEGESAGVDE